MQVSAAREIRLVARALDRPAMEPVGFFEAGLQLLLHGQRDLQGERRDGVDQQLPDRLIQTAARDALTDRFRVRDASTLTDIGRQGVPWRW